MMSSLTHCSIPTPGVGAAAHHGGRAGRASQWVRHRPLSAHAPDRKTALNLRMQACLATPPSAQYTPRLHPS